jgi:hypothetical protein
MKLRNKHKSADERGIGARQYRVSPSINFAASPLEIARFLPDDLERVVEVELGRQHDVDCKSAERAQNDRRLPVERHAVRRAGQVEKLVDKADDLEIFIAVVVSHSLLPPLMTFSLSCIFSRLIRRSSPRQ